MSAQFTAGMVPEDTREKPLDLLDLRTIEQVHRAAASTLEPSVASYIDTGADRDITVRENELIYRGFRWIPRVSRDVTNIDLGTDLWGTRWNSPIGIAPIGMCARIHPDAEVGMAQAAATHRAPVSISDVASIRVPEVAKQVGGSPSRIWSQLYITVDRAATLRRMDDAAAAGIAVLEVTVDAPTAGNRPATQTRRPRSAAPSFDPSVTWRDLEELRRRWHGQLLVKGLLGAADARRACDAGVDGIHLSNHGGRQLDQTVSPLAVLAPVRRAVSAGTPIVVDGGIRTGSDAAIALALGADAVMVGRPAVWGLAVAGGAGVSHVLDILNGELERTMRFLGVSTLAQLREHAAELLSPGSLSVAH